MLCARSFLLLFHNEEIFGWFGSVCVFVLLYCVFFFGWMVTLANDAGYGCVVQLRFSLSYIQKHIQTKTRVRASTNKTRISQNAFIRKRCCCKHIHTNEKQKLVDVQHSMFLVRKRASLGIYGNTKTHRMEKRANGNQRQAHYPTNSRFSHANISIPQTLELTFAPLASPRN